ARERNVGWRIDSFFVDAPLYPSVKSISHLNDFMGSDHCPIVMEIEV
ncbi:MAG: exodeoxyribonuclease III, partial [Spirochaetia bacterium]|nr:exodeoxyribonuclease III [Spirochaetia bacterium]